MPFKVLYLDDEPELCENFADYFSTDDVVVLTYTDSQKAIEASKQAIPDVILVDYRLTDSNGEAAAQEMLNHIPKYLITGEINVVTTFKFKGVFGKPLDFDSIQNVFSELQAKKLVE